MKDEATFSTEFFEEIFSQLSFVRTEITLFEDIPSLSTKKACPLDRNPQYKNAKTNSSKFFSFNVLSP